MCDQVSSNRIIFCDSGGLGVEQVVHGNHTASGFPLLANDPHLSLSAPSVWMLIHVKSPSLECIGASFPGIPGCVLGHNKFISWGVTNAMTDIQDLYIMQGNETHYKYQGEMRPYGIREEVIKVQGGSPTVLRLRETVHGTVVNNDNIEEYGEPPLALRWLATDPTVPDTTVMAFMGVIRSKNWNDFYEANRYYVSPAQVNVHIRINLCVCLSMCLYLCVCVGACVFVCLCSNVCLCACTHVCVRVLVLVWLGGFRCGRAWCL